MNNPQTRYESKDVIEMQHDLLLGSFFITICFVILLLYSPSWITGLLLLLNLTGMLKLNYHFSKYYTLQLTGSRLLLQNTWFGMEYEAKDIANIAVMHYPVPYTHNPFIQFTTHQKHSFVIEMHHPNLVYLSDGGVEEYIAALWYLLQQADDSKRNVIKEDTPHTCFFTCKPSSVQ